jgi:hypothetical protein
MAKVLTIAAMAIAGLLLLVFGLDLAIKVPFGRAYPIMSACFAVLAAVLAYLGWSTIREFR